MSSSEKTSGSRTAVLMGLLSNPCVMVTIHLLNRHAMESPTNSPYEQLIFSFLRVASLGNNAMDRSSWWCRPLRHDPPDRVPAGSPSSVGDSMCRGGLAALNCAMWRRP